MIENRKWSKTKYNVTVLCLNSSKFMFLSGLNQVNRNLFLVKIHWYLTLFITKLSCGGGNLKCYRTQFIAHWSLTGINASFKHYKDLHSSQETVLLYCFCSFWTRFCVVLVYHVVEPRKRYKWSYSSSWNWTWYLLHSFSRYTVKWLNLSAENNPSWYFGVGLKFESWLNIASSMIDNFQMYSAIHDSPWLDLLYSKFFCSL